MLQQKNTAVYTRLLQVLLIATDKKLGRILLILHITKKSKKHLGFLFTAEMLRTVLSLVVFFPLTL